MKLHILSVLLPIILLFNTQVHADVDVLRDEDYIPFHALIQQEVQLDSGTLQVGERVVVVRPLTADSIRVDVPRKGLFTISVAATDLTVEIERMKQSPDTHFKLVPRMAFFLTNRMMSGSSGWQDPLPTEAVHAFQRWILLYGDARQEATQSAVLDASQYYSLLNEDERRQTAFLYMDVAGDKLAIQSMAETLIPSIQCMPGYLSRGYSRSLDQIDPALELPQLVEVAPSGRILHQVAGLPRIRSWLDQ